MICKICKKELCSYSPKYHDNKLGTVHLECHKITEWIKDNPIKAKELAGL